MRRHTKWYICFGKTQEMRAVKLCVVAQGHGFSSDLLQPIKHVQVLVDGSLYWKPRKQRCDYCVTMNVHDEKFTTKKLPTSCDAKDKLLLNFGGTVGFVTNATHI